MKSLIYAIIVTNKYSMGRGLVLLHDTIQMSYLSFVAGFLFVLFTLFNSVIPVAKKKYSKKTEISTKLSAERMN